MKTEKSKSAKSISDFPQSENQPLAVLFKRNENSYVVLITQETVDMISETTKDKSRLGEWLHGAEWVARWIFGLPYSVNVDTTTDYHFGYSTKEQFYQCWVADCAFPPTAIVDGDSFEDALATFECEFERWMKLDELAIKDYLEEDPAGENLHYNDNGTAIDSESVNATELELVSVCYALDWSKEVIK